MIEPSLRWLIWMLFRGGLRRAWRQLKTPSGFILCIVVVGFLSLAVGPSLAIHYLTAGDRAREIHEVSTVLPIAIFAFALLNMFTDAGKQAMELSPPELQFVLAGPYSDRQILTYRLTSLFTAWLPASMFIAVAMIMFTGSWFTTFVCVYLSGMLAMLVSVTRALLAPRLPKNAEKWIQLPALVATILLVLGGAAKHFQSPSGWSMLGYLQAMQESLPGKVLTFPFRPFANIVIEPLGTMTLVWTGLSATMVAAVMMLCYRVNAGFAELAVEGVARRTAKLERLKSGHVFKSNRMTTSGSRSIRPFPWLGGAGPVAWMQSVTSWRRSGRLLILVGTVSVLGTVAAFIARLTMPNLVPQENGIAIMPIAMGISCYISYLFITISPLGFAIPSSRLMTIKTLPVNPIPLALGMMTGMLLSMFAIRTCVFLPATILSTHSVVALIAILCAGYSLDIAMATTINFVTASTSLRAMPQGTPDILQGGRTMLFMLSVGLALMPTIMLASGMVGLVGAFTEYDWTVCSFVAAVTILGVQPLVWWLTGTVFHARELDK